MGCQIGQNSLFGGSSNYIKFQGGDLIAIEGPNTVERQMLSDLKMYYKQLLKGRIVLRAGQVNYLMNHLGLGDNATFLSMVARYDAGSKMEEDNYITWSFYDDLATSNPMSKFMCLTGNSTNRIKQLYLTNPNASYPVIIDVMVGVLDDSYNFFNDTVNQVGTTFTGLSYTDLKSFVVGESIVVNDKNSKPLIYFLLVNIESIQITDKMLSIDDSSLGIIYLVFSTENDAQESFSRINYALENPNVDISNLPEDNSSPVLYWFSNVDNDVNQEFISLNGMTDSVPYNTNDGFTFSTTISLFDYAVNDTLTKNELLSLLVDNVVDSRDGTMSITASGVVLVGPQGTNVSQVEGDGTYSMSFDFKDIAGNGLDGVILNLTIIP
jgi:hypothetical protein